MDSKLRMFPAIVDERAQVEPAFHDVLILGKGVDAPAPARLLCDPSETRHQEAEDAQKKHPPGGNCFLDRNEIHEKASSPGERNTSCNRQAPL